MVNNNQKNLQTKELSQINDDFFDDDNFKSQIDSNFNKSMGKIEFENNLKQISTEGLDATGL